MPRRGSYFFLLAQEKCNQKEGHPGSPVARSGDSPALLTAPGGGLELARSAARPRAQTIAHRLPPARLRYLAARRGPTGVAVPAVGLRFT